MSNLSSKRIDSIQAIRFVAALCVSLFHFGYISPHISGHTIYDVKFFVNMFFCISGFFVVMSTENIDKRKSFLTRRFIRLIPLYWAMTFVTFAAAQIVPELLGYKPDIIQLIKSLFCIPFSRGALKASETLRPIVGLGHTLQMEVAFSIIFFIAMRISHKYRAIIATGVVSVLAIVGNLIKFDSPFFKFYLNVNWSSWFFFALGILCFYIVKEISKKDRISKKLFGTWTALTVVSLATPQFFWATIKQYNLDQYIQLVMCLFFVIEIILIDKLGAKTPKLIVHLGNASFSYYLIHYYIVAVAERYLHINSFSPRNILLSAVVIVIAWVVSYVSYFVIENLFSKWLTKVILLRPKKEKKKKEKTV